MSSQLDTIYAGATLDFLVETLTGYPASAGWTLRLVLNPRAGGSVRTINSVADGDAHRLQATAATTATWATGEYARQAWVLNGAGEQYPVTDLFGRTQVRPGLGAAAGTDMRTEAEQALAAIQATLRGKADSAVQSYQINGRQLSSYSLAELLMLEQRYIRAVEEERTGAKIAAGLGGRKGFYVRM